MVDADTVPQGPGDGPVGVVGRGDPVRGIGEVLASDDSAVQEPVRDISGALGGTSRYSVCA